MELRHVLSFTYFKELIYIVFKSMNRELIINVNPTEVSIALCEDKVLVELKNEQGQTGFSVGDIYLGRVR